MVSRALSNQRTTAQIVRGYRGPALFSFGFRPFFLLAGVFAALAVPLWIVALLSGGGLAANLTRDWHVHEMLFGYTAAVVTGYLIIAGANWTGRYPVAGAPLIVLVLLWLAGRVTMVLGGAAVVIDAAFLPLFAAALWREQFAARNGRNLVPCVVVTLLAAANIAFHLRVVCPVLGPASERAALGLIALLIAVIGGRLVPSFTRNWIANRRAGPEPAPYGPIDTTVSILTGTALAMWQLLPHVPVTGALLALAGAATLLRMARWRGWVAWREPILAVLHLGYLWLALALVLLGLAISLPAMIPQTSAVHALTAGAIGVTTVAMMTRTTLSHTGRARRIGPATWFIYLMVNAAALLRVLAPFFPNMVPGLLEASAICWSAAFALYAAVYGPMLATRRPAR